MNNYRKNNQDKEVLHENYIDYPDFVQIIGDDDRRLNLKEEKKKICTKIN